MEIVNIKVSELKPYEKNARIHNEEQIKKLAESIEKFGFNSPILVDLNNKVLAGHGRILAAKFLGIEKVPCVRIENLTEEQKRAYILVDNMLNDKSFFDKKLLEEEINDLAKEMCAFDFEENKESLKIEEEYVVCPKCNEKFLKIEGEI